MLYSLSKQIAHCYLRAGECRELAALTVSQADRDFRAQREQSWLTLARSYELSERVSRFSKELDRRSPLRWTQAPSISMETGPLQCPSCAIPMDLKASCLDEKATVRTTTIVQFALFTCPNCGRVSDQFVAKPKA
jgi:uncharacterized protein with PIN domain